MEDESATLVELQKQVHDLRGRHRDLELLNQQMAETNGELEESRALLADLYDFAPVVYLSLDRQCRILAANLTAAAMFGRERGSLIGKVLTSIVAVSDQRVLRAHVQRCLSQHIRVDSELSFTVRGRPLIYTQITSMPHFDERGNVTSCKTIITDISALKWSQQKLQFLTRASALLGSTFDTPRILSEIAHQAVPDLADLCMVDLVQPNGEVRRVEAALAEGDRMGRLQLLRTNPPRVTDGTAIGQVLRTRQPLLIEHCTLAELNAFGGLEHDALTKAVMPMSVMYVPIVGHGETLGVLTFACASPSPATSPSSGRHYSPADLDTVRDLASRVALAMENARLYGQAQSAIAARQDVLQFVSHDLRNPLMGIMLSAETILRATPAPDRRRSGSQISRIARAAKQMRRMIEDLLDAASVDAGHLSIEIGPHPAGEIVDEAMDLLEAQAAAKGIKLIADVGSEAAIACDRQRVVQVLVNLVDNALKFTPTNGRVTVSAHIVGDNMLFAVADTGSGIPPGVRPFVFDRYRQAVATARQGRGLGLYIAKALVEAQKGSIWVDSKEGAGTTFSFTLPLASGADADKVGPTMEADRASAVPISLVRRE